MNTVEPGDSKPVDSKLQDLVNATIISLRSHYLFHHDFTFLGGLSLEMHQMAMLLAFNCPTV